MNEQKKQSPKYLDKGIHLSPHYRQQPFFKKKQNKTKCINMAKQTNKQTRKNFKNKSLNLVFLKKNKHFFNVCSRKNGKYHRISFRENSKEEKK